MQDRKFARLIILDRDGVINYNSKSYIKNPDEWVPIPGSLEAMATLCKAGHTIVVATNQSGVGRNYYSFNMLENIHKKMRAALATLKGYIDHIYICPHRPEDGCSCRKPKPGLLLTIAQDYPELFKQALFVGDSLTDIQAAQAAGCQPILVKTGHGTLTATLDESHSVPVFENLLAFSQSMAFGIS